MEHFSQSSTAPPCPTECVNPDFSKTLEEDRFKMGLATYYDLALMNHPKLPLAYQLIREAIMAGGPVPAAMMADGPFMSYRSGVYTHSCDMGPNHAVTAIGWEPDAWICLNSWDPHWGDGGSFKVGLCVLTHATIPTVSMAGSSNGYGFPLAGSTATPAPGLNPAGPYPSVDAAVDAISAKTDRGCLCSDTCEVKDWYHFTEPWCFVVDSTCQGTNWGYCQYEDSPATTTTAATTTATTTMATTTTTTTTATTTLMDDFQPVDGGTGRACRGANVNDNSNSYYSAAWAE